MGAEAPGLIEVPKQDDRAGTVGDHLNFRLVGSPTEEENLAFQVCGGSHCWSMTTCLRMAVAPKHVD